MRIRLTLLTLAKKMRSYPLSILVALALSGCGIIGGTREFKITYSPLVWNECQYEIHLVELSMAPDAGMNQAVGAYNFGRFGEADRGNLKNSLAYTLEQLNDGSGERVEIRVFVHRYAMSFSNDEVAILAIVDWSAIRDESVIIDEVFYAAHYVKSELFAPAGTLGSIKDRVNGAIVRHIANKAFSYSCESHGANSGELIHYTSNEALAVFPERVGSSAMFIDGVFIPGSNNETFFDYVIDFEKIDWAGR